MCIKFFNGLPMVAPLVSPSPSDLAPLPPVYLQNHLFGLSYSGGFKQFSQNNGYLPFANQSVTPDSLGLVNGQIFGQPLVGGR